MIHLIDDYYASVDSNCYTLLRGKRRGQKRRKEIHHAGILWELVRDA